MSDLSTLYQELIVDHSRNPRHFGVLTTANRKAAGINPLCGDQLTLYLQIELGVIKAISFEGRGCAISIASASLMADQLCGKTVEAAVILFEAFHQQVTMDQTMPPAVDLGKLAALVGVRAFSMRVKCATLVWHTLKAALAQTDRSQPIPQISTE
jgi:nitrogen fixation protein NifU and related proteins